MGPPRRAPVPDLARPDVTDNRIITDSRRLAADRNHTETREHPFSPLSAPAYGDVFGETEAPRRRANGSLSRYSLPTQDQTLKIGKTSQTHTLLKCTVREISTIM